eukprot:ANDGO_02886.mRNA.1 Derlin-1
MPTISELFNAMPVWTRYWVTASLGLSVVTFFGLVSPYSVLWDWHRFLYHFQFYRIFSLFYLGPLSFASLINLFLISRYSASVESSFPNNTPYPSSGYLFMWMQLAALSLASTAMSPLVPGFVMMFAVLHVYARQNPHTVVSLMFGIQIEAMYLAIAFGVFSALQGDYMHPLVGIMAGHAYYLIGSKWHVPSFVDSLARLVPIPESMQRAQNSAAHGGPIRFGGPQPPSGAAYSGPPSGSSPSSSRYFSGRGRTLGES